MYSYIRHYVYNCNMYIHRLATHIPILAIHMCIYDLGVLYGNFYIHTVFMFMNM